VRQVGRVADRFADLPAIVVVLVIQHSLGRIDLGEAVEFVVGVIRIATGIGDLLALVEAVVVVASRFKTSPLLSYWCWMYLHSLEFTATKTPHQCRIVQINFPTMVRFILNPLWRTEQ